MSTGRTRWASAGHAVSGGYEPGVGQTPTNVFVAPDGTRAYVTNIRTNDVTVLNIA